MEFLLATTRGPAGAVTERGDDTARLSALAGLSPEEALRVVLHGLVYLHARSGRAHGNVWPEAVVVDGARRRAMLSVMCMKEFDLEGVVGDVRAAFVMLRGMLGDRRVGGEASGEVMDTAVDVVEYRRVISIEDACHCLADACAEVKAMS